MLWCLAGAWRRGSQQQPLPPDTAYRVVAVYGRRSAVSYVAMLGVWMAACGDDEAGAPPPPPLVVAPLNPWATAGELARMLRAVRPALLLLSALRCCCYCHSARGSPYQGALITRRARH
jgi:hypothetical protein